MEAFDLNYDDEELENLNFNPISINQSFQQAKDLKFSNKIS